jgi:hypothetical protein
VTFVFYVIGGGEGERLIYNLKNKLNKNLTYFGINLYLSRISRPVNSVKFWLKLPGPCNMQFRE